MRADRIISSSVYNADLVCKVYNVKKSKISIVPHGINISKYHRRETGLKERLGLVGKKVVLFVGRLEKRKGVHILADCIPQVIRSVPDTYFVFVGRDTYNAPTGGSFRKYIYKKTKANVCKDHIIFTGYLFEEELIEYYSICDIFVAPSLYESFGLVYLEAMACSKPVIGTKVGGIPEVIVDGETGLLVPPRDSKALGNTIINLLVNDGKRKVLGFNARREVEESFSDIVMAKKTLEVFNEIAK